MSKSTVKYIDEVHDHVALCIRQYPTLYKCRTFVLHHIFCVNGNGYRWENGRPWSETASPIYKTANAMIKDKRKMRDQRLGDQRLLDIVSSPRFLISEAYEESILRFRFDNSYNLALIPWVHKDSMFDFFESSRNPDLYSGHFYPMSPGYNMLDNIPNNVKPAWLAAAREMIMEILSAPKSAHSMLSYSAEQNEKVYRTNIRLAKKVSKDLNLRFGKGEYKG